MAGLAGKNITDTYKDLLTVSGTSSNEGLTTGLKQIFDGEGVGSPLWVSTSLLQVGSSSTTASIDVYGRVSAKQLALMKTDGTDIIALTPNDNGSVNMVVPFVTKQSVTFQHDGSDDIVMDAQNSAMKRGDGSKGNVKLGSTDVTLQKGTTDLLTAKEDGTIKFQNVNSLPSNPEAGDLINYNGVLNVGV
tara:strand:+ start:306 stop:875 length:570 start_codon:yes stop_codon:yes gene_type:complete